MRKIKIGDIVYVSESDDYGLVIDKHKILGETRTVNLFLFNKHNHGERIISTDVNNVKYIAHSYDFDSLRSTLPKKISVMLK